MRRRVNYEDGETPKQRGVAKTTVGGVRKLSHGIAKKDRERFRFLYDHIADAYDLEFGPIEVLALIMNGKVPVDISHPFLKQLEKKDAQVRRLKNPPKWWDRFYADAVRSLAVETVSIGDIIISAKELLSYMYPKLKAVDHKSSDKSMTPVLNMILGDELKSKMDEFEIIDSDAEEVTDVDT